MTKKTKEGKLSRLTPKDKATKGAARPQPLGIPLVSELQVRQPVIIAAGKSYQTPNA